MTLADTRAAVALAPSWHVHAAFLVQKQQDREDLQRQDVAWELARMGVNVNWQDHRLADLIDWRGRIGAAQALHAQHGVTVDWHALSLAALTDMRLRADKASQLASLHGIHIDWQRYSWAAIEALRRQLLNFSGGDGAAAGVPLPAAGVTDVDDDGLVAPGSVGRGRYRQSPTPRDRDALMAPTFAFATPLVWSRSPARRVKHDPDAILIPTFLSVPPPPSGPDDLMDPWNPYGNPLGDELPIPPAR